MTRLKYAYNTNNIKKDYLAQQVRLEKVFWENQNRGL